MSAPHDGATPHGIAAGLRSTSRWLEPAVAVAVLVGIWELVSRLGVLPDRDFPPATQIFLALIDDVQTSELWLGIADSLRSWALGLAIVTVTAIPAGVLIGTFRTVQRCTQLLIELVRPVPTVALLPLLILIYGTGVQLAAALVVLTAIWPLLIQTIYGVQDADPVVRDTGRAYGLSKLQQYRYIVIPSSLPYLATGMRLSATLALVAAIAASLIAGGSGLGAAISSAASGGSTDLMYARVFVTGLLGLAVTLLFVQFERRALHWHHSYREVPA